MPRKRRSPASRPPAPLWESPYPTLDLHGDTADAARQRAERWLRLEQEAGERTVRIITGRGLHSVGPPVLPLEIEGLLATLKGSLVADFGSEPGGGSFRVELRRPRRPREVAKQQPSRPATPDDLPLRRAAEESLADLGVAPTPALVEAEMERLRRG
jgi:hypothetical protein